MSVKWVTAPFALAGDAIGGLVRRQVVTEEVVEETTDAPAEAAAGEAPRRGLYKGEVPVLAESLGERIREAAEYRSQGLGWEFLLNEIGAHDERRWIGALSEEALQRVATMAPDAIEEHVRGRVLISGLPPVKRRPGQPFAIPEPAPDPETPDAPKVRMRERQGSGSKKPRPATDHVPNDLADIIEMIEAEEAYRAADPRR